MGLPHPSINSGFAMTACCVIARKVALATNEAIPRVVSIIACPPTISCPPPPLNRWWARKFQWRKWWEAISNLRRLMQKSYAIYIMTNTSNNVLYTGVTSNLKKRIYEHKNKIVKGFTEKYNIDKLVYYEIFDSSLNAIIREKQIKAGSRSRKIKLIEDMNKNWKDLYCEL